MSDSRRNIRGTHVVGVLFVALLALSAYVVQFATPHQEAGASVHAKNSATPGWMLDLNSRNADQSPITVQNDEPSFWI